MKLQTTVRIRLLALMVACLPVDAAVARRFDPPPAKELAEIEKKLGGERLLSLMKIDPEDPDYAGRRFTSINDAKTHHILGSDLFREGFSLYKTPGIDTGIKPAGVPSVSLMEKRHIYLGRERGPSLQPELLREIKSLNEIAGFIGIKSKKDAIEYARLGSSSLTWTYFAPQMEELFCVSESGARSNGQMMTFEECAKLGLGDPMVKKLKKQKIKIESDTGEGRFKMSSGPSKAEEDDGNDDDDAADGSVDVKSFLVTRNMVIDTGPANGFYRVTEEVGRNGEWKIVEKKLIKAFSKSKSSPGAEDLSPPIDKPNQTKILHGN